LRSGKRENLGPFTKGKMAINSGGFGETDDEGVPCGEALGIGGWGGKKNLNPSESRKREKKKSVPT